eukprot:TRINITY_DN11797_c0_g1_i1.p1 TRINITY_DN11797_c0_g1~~TRINITY_DN11797_c0_g1_i1.p1  ORF type:complete len:553 (-),score=114.15 TRINITY_DN11797_c0_g1_i1:76-1734(-)
MLNTKNPSINEGDLSSSEGGNEVELKIQNSEMTTQHPFTPVNDETEEGLIGDTSLDLEAPHSKVFVIDERLSFNKTNAIKKGVLLSVITIVALILYLVPIMTETPTAHRCLALLIWTALLWTTEVVPIYITSLCVPVLVVVLQILPPAAGQEYSAKTAATAVMGQMFGEPVLLALGAFTMSAALTKYQLSLRLAMWFMSLVPNRPPIIMLSLMFLGLFLSMWISNVASPVVVIAIIQPSLAALPDEHRDYAKAVYLGIAFACNIGGMTTPIASPQNIVAIVQVLQNDAPGWGTWLGFAIPFSVICVFVSWSFLWFMYRPKLNHLELVFPREGLMPITIWHIIVLIVSVLTVILWALESEIIGLFGGNGMPSLIPVVIFFAFGFLTKKDLKENLPWDVLLLLAGGLVLGYSILQSQLLDVIANSLANVVSHLSIWVVLLSFASLTWLFGNFVSHTVAAEIILPVVYAVGSALYTSTNVDHRALLVCGAVILDSGAMGLPVSSFPNVQAFAVLDSAGKQYLTTRDFIVNGFSIGLIEVGLLMSVGYGLLLVMHL